MGSGVLEYERMQQQRVGGKSIYNWIFRNGGGPENGWLESIAYLHVASCSACVGTTSSATINRVGTAYDRDNDQQWKHLIEQLCLIVFSKKYSIEIEISPAKKSKPGNLEDK